MIGLGSLAIKGGFDYSVEFTGGTLMQLHFNTPPEPAKLRSALDAGGIKDAEIATVRHAERLHRSRALRRRRGRRRLVVAQDRRHC